MRDGNKSIYDRISDIKEGQCTESCKSLSAVYHYNKGSSTVFLGVFGFLQMSQEPLQKREKGLGGLQSETSLQLQP